MQYYPACDYCRTRKRKCDRRTPKCGLCTQKSQRCIYTRHLQPGFLEHYPDPPGSGAQITYSDPNPATSDFPPCYFLDREIFDRENLRLSTDSLQSSAFINEAVISPTAISLMYFDWAHLWMPIVAKRRWFNHHITPLAAPRTDIKVLLLCMKLITWTPDLDRPNKEPRTEDYLAAKQIFHQAELCGAVSLQLMQALLLLTIYEYSHAIYPAAYMSVATCARYGLALGIDKQRREESLDGDLSLEQQEERRRLWWAVVILDRILSPESTSSPEPRPDDLLPVHDQAWDEGTFSTTDMYTVSSAARSSMGMFARLAQASHLLGRALRHRRTPTHDAAFNIGERVHIQGALRALLNLMYEEGSTEVIPICPQTALCLSAMATLNSEPTRIGKTSDSASQLSADASGDGSVIDTLETLRPIAEESLLTTEVFYRDRPWPMKRSSPLLLHWTYQIAVTFFKLGQRTLEIGSVSPEWNYNENRGERAAAHNEAVRGFETMRTKLKLLGQQWCAAEEYLRILEVRLRNGMLG